MVQCVSLANGRSLRPASLLTGLCLAAALGASARGQLLPTVGPQVRVDAGGGVEAANETTISSSEAAPNCIVAGWNDWRNSGASEVISAGFSLSTNSGASWNDFLIRPPVPNQSGVEGDPMTAFDPRTGTLWAGAISFSSNGGIYVARKDPGNSFFNPSVMARAASGTDKCWMAAGPRPLLPNTTRLYIAYNEGVIWSDDLGTTWTSPNSLGSGIGFLPRVGPGGELYVAYWDFGNGVLLKRSLDGGNTFTTHTIATRMDVWGTQSGDRFPGDFRVPPLNYLDVDRSTGYLYACYFDTTSFGGGNANVDLYFTKSTDQGNTWTTPTIVQAGLPTTAGDEFFCWIETDKDSRLHLVYMTSGNVAQNDNDNDGMFDTYYAYSVNDGDDWFGFRLTPNSYNSDDDGLDRFNQFMGDYLGLTVSGNRAYPAYIDSSAGDTDTFTNVVQVPVWGDTDGDGFVGFSDVLNILAGWGPCGAPPCASDIDGDGVTGFSDLLIALTNWS